MAIRSLGAAGFALLGTLAVPPAMAESAYLGLSAGETQVDDVCDQVADLGVGASDCDDTDTGGKVFVGWALADAFHVEAAFVDLGEAESDILGQSSSVEADGVSLSAVGLLPLGNVDLFAKIGAFNWDAEGDGALTGFEDDGTDATYGVGARVGLNEHVALRAEAERYEIGDHDVDMASVGISFLF